MALILAKLKQENLKLTDTRKLTIQAMLNHRGPFQADDIISQLKKKGVDGVTVYRTIQTLLELELLNTVSITPSAFHYEFDVDQDHHHHHVICKKCRKVEPLHVCITPAQKRLVEKMGYTKISHTLEFHGLCSRCS